jgi:hypothetical protein
LSGTPKGVTQMLIVRFLVLVLLLNVLRYAGGFLFEPWVIFPGLFSAMEESASFFRTEFQTIDWVTSYLYNFMMWLSCVWVFHIARPAIEGSDLIASAKIFGVMWLSFASISFIYMNHYAHPRDFYVWNVFDALLVFALVGVGNGLIYRKIMGPCARGGA